MLFMMLPQLFCWPGDLPSNFSRYYFFSSNLRLQAQPLSRVWLPNYAQRPCLVKDRSFFQNVLSSKGYWVRNLPQGQIFPRVLHYISFSSRTVKARQKSFRPLLEATTAHSDHKRRRWIFHARSDFWWEKSCGGRLHKFTSVWVGNLSALAILASITGTTLFCVQRGECNGAVATGNWTW